MYIYIYTAGYWYNSVRERWGVTEKDFPRTARN